MSGAVAIEDVLKSGSLGGTALDHHEVHAVGFKSAQGGDQFTGTIAQVEHHARLVVAGLGGLVVTQDDETGSVGRIIVNVVDQDRDADSFCTELVGDGGASYVIAGSFSRLGGGDDFYNLGVW